MSEDNIREILERYRQPGTKITARLCGRKPGMLMHSAAAMRLHDEASKAYKGRGKFTPTPEQEAEWGAYRTEDGALCLPAKNIHRAVVEAGKAFKRVKGMGTMATVIASASIIDDEAFVLHDDDGNELRDYKIDVQRVVVARQGIQRARPLIEEWTTDVVFFLDTEALIPEQFAGYIAYAGSRIGVGDLRPEKRGQYGRFDVTEFLVEEQA